MQHLKNFSNKILKYDLVNKFFYNKSEKIPVLKKIVLNFNCNTKDIKQVVSSALAIELIASQGGLLKTKKNSIIRIKIKDGNPVGCIVTLRNINMYSFLFRSITEIIPQFQNFKEMDLITSFSKKNSYSYEFSETFCFAELEDHYPLFNSVNELKVTIVASTSTKTELQFILNEFHLLVK